jgi:hypothetical protein
MSIDGGSSLRVPTERQYQYQSNIYIYIYMVVAVCAFQQRGNISIKADQVLACLQGGVQCCAKPVLLVA